MGDGTIWDKRVIPLKGPADVAAMRRAGMAVAAVLRELRAAAAPGVSTADLDGLAQDTLLAYGAASNFKGYLGYPAVVCTSVNDEIIHGIPSSSRVLRAGDLVGLDAGAVVEGWHADGAVTIGVGRISAAAQSLLDCTRTALERAIAIAAPGVPLDSIGDVIQTCAEEAGFGVVRNYVGHGIGRALHEAPHVPNYRQGKPGPLLEVGMCLAIEPMFTAGSYRTRVLPDGWTIVTADGSLAAHFEHSIAITESGAVVLTA